MSWSRRQLLSYGVAVGLVGRASTGRAEESALVGKVFPDLDVTAPDGTPQKLSQWKGQALLLHFWATWCRPCVSELPKLDRLHQRLAGVDKAAVLTVCVDEVPVRPQVAAIMKQHGYSMPVVFEATGAASRTFGIQVLPLSFLVDSTGIVRSQVVGGREWDDDQWVGTLERLRGV